MARITYRQFKSYLENEKFYTSREIRHLFNSVKQMDKESRGWVIEWIESGKFPTKVVEQITVEELVKDFGYKPINAFIAIDWLKHDPDAAKYFIIKSVPAIAETDARRAIEVSEQATQTDENAPTVGLNSVNTGDVIEA